MLNVAPAFLALPACGCGGGLALSEDAGPEDVRSDAAGPTFSDVAQTSPDVPVSPDLPQALPDASPASADVAASPDLPWAPDRPPSDARPPVDLPNPADGSGDPGRYYERPDVFTHEARPLDSGSVDASAVVTEYPLRISDCSPQAIVAGPDGDLWFTEARGRIGRITPAGAITEFAIPTVDSFPAAIVSGPDGDIWFNKARSATSAPHSNTAITRASRSVPTETSGSPPPAEA